MDFNDYQLKAVETALPQIEQDATYMSLGLAGEAGEVANKMKKVIRDCGTTEVPEERREAIASELGDVLWYAANLAACIGYLLEDIAELHISKLEDRKTRGVLGGDGDNR